jgi:hypothetical protein
MPFHNRFPQTQTAEADQTVVRMGDLMLDMPEDTTPQETSALSSFFMSMLEPAPGFNPIQDIIQSPTPVREAIRKAPFLPMSLAMAISGGSGKKKVVKAGARRIESKKTVDKLLETLERNEFMLWDDYNKTGGVSGVHRGGGTIGHKTNYSIRSDREMDEIRHHISVNKPEGMASVDFVKKGDEIGIGTLESLGTQKPGQKLVEEAMEGKPLRKRYNIQRQSALQELLGAVAEYANRGDIVHPGSLTSDSFTMITNALRKGGLKKKFKIVTAEDLKAMVAKGSLPEGWTAERAREMIEGVERYGTRRLSTGGDLNYTDAFGSLGRKKNELATAMDMILAPNKTSLRGLDRLLDDIKQLEITSKRIARKSPRNLDANVSKDFTERLEASKKAIKELQDMYWKIAEGTHGKSGARRLDETQRNAIWDYLSTSKTSTYDPRAMIPEGSATYTEKTKGFLKDVLSTQDVFHYKPFAIIKK